MWRFGLAEIDPLIWIVCAGIVSVIALFSIGMALVIGLKIWSGIRKGRKSEHG